MELTYRVQRADLWRGAVYSNTHHPQLLVYLLYPLFLILLNVTLPLMRGDFTGALWVLLRFLVLMFLTAFVVIAFTTYKRMPSENTERFCTERIGPYGFECLVPEGHRYAAWQDVLKITETPQDFFLFAKKGKSYIIPKRAFGTPEQAQAFLQAAETYRSDAKSGLPPPTQEGIWPPAPRATDSQEPGETQKHYQKH